MIMSIGILLIALVSQYFLGKFIEKRSTLVGLGLATCYLFVFFVLQLFIIDISYGIGPEVLKGNIPATSAIRDSLLGGAFAAYFAWSKFKASVV